MSRFVLLAAAAALFVAAATAATAFAAEPIAQDADIDNDGLVSILDLAFLTSNLEHPRSDLNGDGHVSIFDIAILVGQFGNRVSDADPSATPADTPTLPPTPAPTPVAPTSTPTRTPTLAPATSTPTPTLVPPTNTPTWTPTPVAPTSTPTRTPTPVPPVSTPTPAAPPSAPAGQGVVVRPDDDVQAIVNANPAGTTFQLDAGMYLSQSVTPKNGNVFFANGLVIFDGDGAQFAFRGSATGVVIDGLIIEDYNPGSQRGAISNQHNGGTSWTIRNSEFRYNNGYGVRANTGDQLINNYLHHNTQAGLGGVGANILAEGNEIAFNNPDDLFDAGWEAGGTKWTKTTNLVLRNNNVHDNHGPGLWADIDNIYTLYEGNVLRDNYGPGIFHEISYEAVIRNNTATGNGTDDNCGCWLWGAQIQISTSQNVEVYGNTVVSPYNASGIGVIQQNRGSGPMGTYVGYPASVHHNDVTLGASGGTIARTGAVQDYDPGGLFFANVAMDYNAYHVDSTTASHFGWNNGWRSWAELQGAGQEEHGTMDTNLP